jgi:molybdate transport system substrate-binding protein
MMKRIVFIAILTTLFIRAGAQKIRIAVAANAQFVAAELVKEFKKETGIEPELIIGASGNFVAQIEQGAPFDVFLSADTKYPWELYNKSLTADKPEVYAYGTLVLWETGAAKASLAGLSDKGIHKIAIANPDVAPYGEAAVSALKKMNLYDELKPKFIYGESIAQVNQYLVTGAVEAAFTAKSVVLDPSQSGRGNWVAVDEKLYQPIAQGVVILKSATGENLVLAKKFYRFIFGDKAKAIFRAYGYK